MTHTPTRIALATALLVLAGATHAAAVSTVSLSKASEAAASIDVQHLPSAGAEISRMQTQHFADGDQLTTWADGGVMMLCRKVGYIKVPADKPEVATLPLEQRQMLVYAAMMGSVGGVVQVMQWTGESVEVADDGSETTRSAESTWAYGVERAEVTTQRMPDGALRVRARKTATEESTPRSGPDADFSTDDDRDARIAELPAVGSWMEVLIGTQPKAARIDPAFSLAGWVSSGEGHAATVGEARAAAGCKD
ncbi:hypothetical protein AB8E26_18450 [Stenotrophomonas rhizophila]|uniref:hypothetical protein n=1 Tax=Stenotrophomonas rhizophila TaxID=216778 RepID=UPI003518192B